MLRRHAGQAALLGVVKANAYGHGALAVTRTLQNLNVRRFAVATVPEGIYLRENGIEDPVLVFASPLPPFLAAYARYDLGVTVSSRDVAEAVAVTARHEGPLRVHVKVDTGMHRIGIAPEEAEAVTRLLERAPGIELTGLWTHFATADEDDPFFAKVQMDRFEAVVKAVGDAYRHLHVANSGALLQLPRSVAQPGRLLARTGIALYGLMADERLAATAGLQPLMRFASRVTQVKTIQAGESISYGRRWTAPGPRRIATVGAGYADGYPRLLTNRAEVGIQGHRYPVAGTVCMDMFMVDLGPPEGPGYYVEAGEEVTLWGEGGPSAFDVARWAETIPYEICCGVATRVPRFYRTRDSG